MQVWQDTYNGLKAQYVERSKEKLVAIAQSLEYLALHPSDWETLRDIMRNFHWMVGSGGIYGFPQVTKLGTHAERMCDQIMLDQRRLQAQDFEKIKVVIDSISSAFSFDDTDQRNTVPQLLLPLKSNEILVVDDDEGNTLLLTRALEEQGLVMRHVERAEDAVRYSLKNPPAGVIIILPLPDSTNPYELVERLRSLPGGQEPPILVISNKVGFLDKVQAIHCGADGFYEVPVDWERLMSRLRYLLERNKPNMYRILSVEDDPDQAMFIRAVLESAGYKVHQIDDPKFFEEALLAVHPDLLLLDIMLPGITGFELARYVRQNERYATLPILFLSTQNALDAHIESARVGADDHLIKPVAPQLLLSAVASRLERARLINSLLHRDGLTKLLTHTAFMDEAEGVVALCKRDPKKLACLFIVDIDHFRQLNTKHGYQTGDRVLTTLSTVMRERLRQSDKVGRYAGEQLIGIVEDLDEYDAIKLATRLLEDFAILEHKAPDGSGFKATVSAGLCMFEPSVMDLNRWRRLTEQAVKAAKSAGRNCVMKAQVSRKAKA
jgi:diguanylate cyclase (GGDEF)-like protein